jgi:acetyl esterase/lipase
MAYEPSAHFEVKTFDVEIPREGNPLLARVYQPQGPGPFPTLLDVHGGAWSGGDRTSDEQTDTTLATSGMLIVSSEIRIGPEDPYPAQMQDINLATRWLKVHAAELLGDASTLGGIGFSSGGHSVVLSAMRPRDSRYAALPLAGAEAVDASLRYVIGCWPIVDPFARYEYAKERNIANLIKNHDGYWLTTDAMKEGNPAMILERGEPAELPPLLVLQGTADDNIPYQIVEAFPPKWRAAGGDATIELFEGEPHGFGNRPGPAQERFIALIKAFVQRCLATRMAAV